MDWLKFFGVSDSRDLATNHELWATLCEEDGEPDYYYLSVSNHFLEFYYSHRQNKDAYKKTFQLNRHVTPIPNEDWRVSYIPICVGTATLHRPIPF